MQRHWLIGSVVLAGLMSLPVAAQAPMPEAQKTLEQQQKAYQYAQIEYQRCRTDVVDLWQKGDAAEKRVKELEAEVARLTEEVKTAKEKPGGSPAN